MLLTNTRQAERLVDAYFTYIKGEFHIEHTPAKTKNSDETIRQKVWDREPEPPTITGLALYLGFDSLYSFEQYENNGAYSSALKRGRLRIEAEYEKKLHQQAPTGAIFALKNLGWTEREINNNTVAAPDTLKVEIVDNGIATSVEERAVLL